MRDGRAAASARARRPVRAPRRLRSAHRQRRLDAVLGRGRVRPDRAAQHAPRDRRVLRRSSRRSRAPRRTSTTRRCARRAPGERPQLPDRVEGDVYAYPHNETSTGVDGRRCTGPTGRRARRRRRHVGRGRHARRRRPRSTSTTSRRRSASRATAGCGSRAARRRRSSASNGCTRATAGSPRRSTSRSRSRTRASTRPTTRPRSRRSSCSTTSCSGCSANGGLEFAAGRCDASAGIALRLGRRPRRTRRRSSPTRSRAAT